MDYSKFTKDELIKEIEKLKERENIYKEVFENIDIGVAIYKAVNNGEDFEFIGMNRAGEKFSQVKLKDILGKRVTKVFPGIKEMGLFNVFVKVYKDGKSRYLNKREYKDDRISEWVTNYVYKLNSNEIVAIYNDVTEIENKTKELEFIIDNSPVIVFLWRNEEGWPVEFVSKNINKFGYTANEFYKGEVEYSKIVYEDDLKRVGQEVAYYSKNNFKEFKQEYRIYSKNRKKIYWIDDRTWIRRNKNGEITHYQGIIFDITKQKEAQIKLEEYKNELESKVAYEIEKQREQEQLLIEQNKLASLGEMLRAIAHQWRQPLNAVGLKVQLLVELYEDEELDINELRDSVNSIMTQVNSMSKTIDDFRNFFKPSGDYESFDIREILNSVYELLSAQFDYLNIKFKLNSTNETFLITGDKNQFRQVILNILNNAKDAIEEAKERKLLSEGIILIDLFKDNNKIILKVWDNGGEVSSEVLNKMFNPYFSTKEEGKGIGMGLYMSKIIIEKNLNGTIFAKNRDGGLEIDMKISLH